MTKMSRRSNKRSFWRVRKKGFLFIKNFFYWNEKGTNKHFLKIKSCKKDKSSKKLSKTRGQQQYLTFFEISFSTQNYLNQSSINSHILIEIKETFIVRENKNFKLLTSKVSYRTKLLSFSLKPEF